VYGKYKSVLPTLVNIDQKNINFDFLGSLQHHQWHDKYRAFFPAPVLMEKNSFDSLAI
jgi:hypothetical protein